LRAKKLARKAVGGSYFLPDSNGSLGSEDGQNAATNAQAVGLPGGMNIWCDLEGVKPGTPSDDVTDYCNNWYDAVNEAGYVPGLYVGDSAILTGEQLYQNLKFAHYWKSQSEVPTVAKRGYQMIQFFPSVMVNGVGIDVDMIQKDQEGGVPLWLQQ